MTIKPVGRPLPAIAVNRPFGYGPPKPLPFAPGFSHGPPSHAYPGPPPPPGFPRPQLGFNGPYSGYKKTPSFGPAGKPIYEDSGLDGEYDFIPEDKHEYLEKKQILVQPNVSPVQQHVHHHFHHEDGLNKGPNGGLIPGGISPSQGGPGGYGYGSSGTYGANFNDFNEYKKAFKIKSPSATNSLDSGTTNGNNYANKFSDYEKNKRDSLLNNKGFSGNQEQGKVLNSGFGGNGLGNFGNNGLGSAGNNFGSFGNNGLGSAGNNFGSFGNNGLGSAGNNFGSNSNNNFGSSGFDNGFSSSVNDDCVCVPYDQCAAIDQAGRKDDLYLAIDPRNVAKNIDAESDDSSNSDTNGNYYFF